MRIYYGWVIVAATLIANLLVLGVAVNSFGVFVIPVSQDLGLSRANMNSAFILIGFGNALFAPFIGRAVDKFPARPILIGSSILLGLGIAIPGMSSSLWLSMAALVLLASIGIDGTAAITMNVLVARWFRRYLARAMALAAIGLSAGGAVIPPLTTVLIENFGWRSTLILLGAALSLSVILIALLVRDWPGANDVEPGSTAVDDAAAAETAATRPSGPASVKDILRTPQFWMLGVGGFSILALFTALSISLVPLAVGKGFSALQASGFLSVVAISGVVAKLFLASFGHLLHRIHQMLAVGCLCAISCVLLYFAGHYALFFLCSMTLGAAWGAGTPIIQTLLVEQFGAESFGTVRGLTGPLASICNALTIRIAGEIFDRTGSYDLMFAGFFAASLAAMAMVASVLFMRPSTRSATELSDTGWQSADPVKAP